MIKGKTWILVLALSLSTAFTYNGNSTDRHSRTTYNNTRKIVILNTQYNNYFIQEGNPQGYHLELLNLFAKQYQIQFDIRLNPTADKLNLLKSNQADLVLFSGDTDSLYQLIASHDDVFASLPLDEKVHSVWLSNSNNNGLAQDFNTWISGFRYTPEYSFLQVKYFQRKHNKSEKQISPYDAIFKQYSSQINWDWRMFAALVYQESMFKPHAKSKHGASGLMQLMPRTANHLGVDISTPEGNVKAGAKLIGELTRQLAKDSIPEGEMIHFVLAAYNCGYGRLADCRAVAKAKGLNPSLWSDVRSVIPSMQRPTAELLKYMPRGKFNGNETYRFVNAITDRYKHYKAYYQ